MAAVMTPFWGWQAARDGVRSLRSLSDFEAKLPAHYSTKFWLRMIQDELWICRERSGLELVPKSMVTLEQLVRRLARFTGSPFAEPRRPGKRAPLCTVRPPGSRPRSLGGHEPSYPPP